MLSGIDLLKFNRKFGADIYSIYKNVIEKNIDDGLLIINKDRMYLTTKGVELSNRVMSDFILEK